MTTLSYADESGNLDPLDRLRKVTRPDGGRTRYEYSDAAGDLYLKTLTEEAHEEFDDGLTKADASIKIDELQEKTGRGAHGSGS